MESKLPKNWVKTSPLEISKIIRGVSYGKTDAFQLEFDNSCLILRGGNIQDGEIVDGKDNVYVSVNLIKNEQFIQKHDVVIVGSTGSKNLIGKAATSLFESDKISFGAFLMNIRASETIDKRYFSYYFQTNYYREAIRNLAGGVNINNIRKEYIENLYFPLPPLAEQNRIVAKLDALFIQHEAIKKSMVRIPELLKNFRQQVLTQAVTGKLTEEWRKGKELGNGIKIVNIEYLVKSLKTDIRTGPFGSALKKDEHKNSGVPIWGIESIGLNGKFTGINKIFVTEEKAKNLKSFEVKGGNIIISRSGTVGELCILPNDVEYGLISTNLMKIILNKEIIISKYFCWLFKGSPMVIEKLNDLCKGSTRLFLTQSILKNLDFPLPSLQEQQEIVSSVESLFDIADNIEQQYKTLKTKIDTLPQAILYKAFKGELSKQLESDGDARELLKQIQELKNSAVKPKKATTKKVNNYPERDGVLGMVAEE